MNQAEVLQQLITLAQDALKSSADKQVDAFVAMTGDYLDTLEKWQTAMNQHNPLLDDSSLAEPEKVKFREGIEKLSTLHSELLSQAGSNKDEVGTQMSEVHKRATGLRKYIDSAPSRITIAGKRKG